MTYHTDISDTDISYMILLMDFYRFFAIKDWTCDKIIEYYYKTYKQKGRKKLLDSIKKDLQKIANSEYILDETRKRKAQEILDYWKVCLLIFNEYGGIFK